MISYLLNQSHTKVQPHKTNDRMSFKGSRLVLGEAELIKSNFKFLLKDDIKVTKRP